MQQKYQIISRNIKDIKKIINFFVCIYKTVKVTKEIYEANGIEVITDEFGNLWLNERHVQEQLGHKNSPAPTNKYDEKCKKCRSKLNESTKQPNRRFIHIDLALKIIMDCRTDKSCNFKRNLGFILYMMRLILKNKQ